MPRGNKTGPKGQGTGTSKGMGRGRGQGRGLAAGPGGYCICPDCGEKVTHKQGTPCYEQQCPKCRTAMIRE